MRRGRTLLVRSERVSLIELVISGSSVLFSFLFHAYFMASGYPVLIRFTSLALGLGVEWDSSYIVDLP